MTKKKTVKRVLNVKGMVCGSCEKIISRQAMKVPGVKDVKADYVKGVCEVTFDGSEETYRRLVSSIEEKGYSCPSEGSKPSGSGEFILILGAFALLVGAYILLAPKIEAYTPALSQNASLLLLFVVGLLTGFHCIAMCGGFVVSYATKEAAEGKGKYVSHLKYGAAKTLSYTFFGAVFGLIGSYITFTPALRGAAAIIAGLFLMIFGLNMFGYLRSLRGLRFKAPAAVNNIISSEGKGPVTIGLLNGLMIACGPLQAIYLMAAASGSPYYGALYLLVFGLGTLPVLLGFGAITSALSRTMTSRILRYSGVVVLLLGLIMVNRGMSLAGSGYDVNTVVASAAPVIGAQPTVSADTMELDADGNQVIRMNVTAYGWQPDKFVLKKGVPVKWIIDGQQITSCNSAIQVPRYNLKFDIKKGLQTITFTPTESGTVPWSCWMGMIPGTFIVKDDVVTVSAQKQQDTGANPVSTPVTVTQPTATTPTTLSPSPSVDSAGYQTIHMNVTAAGWEPDRFILKTGVPVKWVIDGQQITGCNSGIKVPSLGLQFNIKPGLQTIEFTPKTAGTIPWSCLMGMIQGTFIVKDNPEAQDAATLQAELNSLPKKKSGGCGCGMM